MKPQRNNPTGPETEDPIKRIADRKRAWDELERKLDQALMCTFPASDPFQLSSPARVASELGCTPASEQKDERDV